MALIEAFAQALIVGVLLGMIYGLMSVGVGITFGVMRVVNFAQGEFLMLGMYAALFGVAYLGLTHVLGVTGGAYVVALLAGPLMFVLAGGVHRVLLGSITGTRMAGTESEGHYPQMILTLGLSLVIQNLALMAFGATPHEVQLPVSDRAWMIEAPRAIDITVFVNQAQAISAAIAAVVAGLMFLFIDRSKFGKALRAAADNAVAATYVGIDVARAHRLAFAMGAGGTAIAGALAATYMPFQPYIGADFIIVMYAGAVLGGLGSLLGAFWGGLIIGLVEQLSTLVLPLQLQSVAVFVVFVLVLFVRPQGILGRTVDRV